MADASWKPLPFSAAVLLNPPVRLQRGKQYPYVDMNALDPASPTVGPIGDRMFLGGGSRFEQGDTLFARITPCLENGKIARFRMGHAEIRPAHGSTEFIVMRGRDGVSDSAFVAYLARSPIVRDFAVGQMTGSSGRQRVPTDCFDTLEVSLPPLSAQRAIADILGALDDKIEQNRRTSAALERLSRAIFRAWFVDFEPVKAKAAGATGFPSMPQEVFNSLPTRLVDFELGPMPEGWKLGRLGDQCEINEQSVRAGELTGEIQYVDIASVTIGHCVEVKRVDFSDAPSRARRRVRHGDTIWSCVRPNRRSYMFVHDPPENRIVSTGFAVLSPKRFGPSYLYELTTQQEFVDYLVSNADGSTYPAVRADHFATAEVLVPPSRVIEAFDTVTTPLRDLVAAGERESEKLGQLRDYLLPKLLSGEVRAANGLNGDQALFGKTEPIAKAEVSRKATDEFKEAILIAALVRALATPLFPLGRKRYNKFAYFIHRKAEHDVRLQFLKKAAGPYSPWSRYQGPEKIALGNGYIERCRVEKRTGWVVGKKIADIARYLPRYGFEDALNWAIAKFRKTRNDDLELLSTVDFASIDLRGRKLPVNVRSIHDLIASEPEWAPKLNRDIFSDANIANALAQLTKLFPENAGKP